MSPVSRRVDIRQISFPIFTETSSAAGNPDKRRYSTFTILQSQSLGNYANRYKRLALIVSR